MKRLISASVIVLLCALSAWAGDEEITPLSNADAIALVQTHANYLWTLVAAALVFFMQAGFAMVECGFTRAKNAVNIMMKNLMDFSLVPSLSGRSASVSCSGHPNPVGSAPAVSV